VLLTKAAGNENARLGGPADSLDCRPGDAAQLLVGSYGLDEERTSFTNFGPCVDAYAPGELVIAPLPGDWLMLLSGTSFSAPLVSRLLATTSPAPFAVASARASLLALREPNGDIAKRYFPQDLLYDPRPQATMQALGAGHGTGVRQARALWSSRALEWVRWLRRRPALRAAASRGPRPH
jgi:hypothetical protein